MLNRPSVKKKKYRLQSRGRATERGGGPKDCGLVFGVRFADIDRSEWTRAKALRGRPQETVAMTAAAASRESNGTGGGSSDWRNDSLTRHCIALLLSPFFRE